MTSLANQLKKLAVPQTSSLLQDFKRSSFLFDTKEATSIDRDTVYALGVNGLKELETLNKAFKTFHSSLFSESSKLMERSVHTQAVNQNLDKEIKKFLILLSPYFLLRPAHKALEWMIYRFHIEKYNIDDLLACIIPYHDTNYFVRVIQMLDLKSPTHRWNWLMPIQKPGVPLAKGTLFTHCYKDLGFLKFVCSLVSISLQVHALHHSSCGHTVINFYVTTVIGSLEVADKVREEYVSILYPFLSAGLKSENKDCIAATYMVLCQLVRKIQLDKDWLEKLLHLLILVSFSLIIRLKEYPEKFDEAIKKFGHSEIVDEILIKISPDPNLHIHHANSRIRKQATKQLITLVEKNEVYMIFNYYYCCYQGFFSLKMENVDYIKQLILSSINHCCRKIEPNESLSEKQFNIEMIVDCMQSSKSPQTQQQALMLLTYVAEKYPDFVLHSVMKVFTFMSENIVRKDDSYSFQIIRNTIQSIVPIIIESEQKEKGSARVSSVIQVFIDALPDIPEHRRGPLFKNLISVLQPIEEYLWITLVLLFGHVVDKHQSSQSAVETSSQLLLSVKELENEYMQSMNEFGLFLCNAFTAECQIITCEKLIVYLASLPEQNVEIIIFLCSKMGEIVYDIVRNLWDSDSDDEGFEDSKKKSKQSKGNTFELFNLDLHSDKQLRHLKFVAVTFICELLSHETFINQVAENEVDLKVYERLIEVILLYIKSISHSVVTFSSEPTGKFWKALVNKAYDVLDKVNGLLPNHLFVSVITNLMGNSVVSIRRKAMEILNSKLQHQIDFFSEDEVPILLKLVPKLVEVFSLSHDNTDVAVNRQTALFSLKFLARTYGCENKKEFVQVLNAIMDLFDEDNLPTLVKAASFLCLSEVIACLGPHVISSLPNLVPILTSALKNADSEKGVEPILLSALMTIQKLLEHLSNFISPYLKTFIPQISYLSAKYHLEQSEKSSKSQINLRIQTIQNLMSTLIPARVLLPAINDCYEKIVVKDIEALQSLMSMLSERIKTMEKSDISGNLNLLENFFLEAFEFRSKHSEKPVAEITKIEGYIIDSYTCLVLKLSEASFRPFFFKLYNWATQVSDEKEIAITFYRLTERIAETLKGLFMLFAGNLVKHSSTMLTENSVPERKFSNILLLLSIL
ncbi:HEAT repeat-containing protein 1 [Nymphon striatum]|nr:HEAT repeat-containing protein 1 [Nymphon striatum]